MAFAVNKIRRTVSQNKHRYTKHGFDLDLTYITDRILAIGFPAVGLETQYRNPRRQVQRYVETMHKGHYCLFNLCAEKDYLYSPEEFGGNVSFYPFPDHNPSSLQIVADFCTEASEFLDAHPQNVIVVHCKAGRGRTGFIQSCLLVYLGVRPTAAEAILQFGWMRTRDGDAVHQPSQVRYVKYVQFCKSLTNYVSTFEDNERSKKEDGENGEERVYIPTSYIPLQCIPLSLQSSSKSQQAEQYTYHVDELGRIYENKNRNASLQPSSSMYYNNDNSTFTTIIPKLDVPDVPLLSAQRTEYIVQMYDATNVRLVQSQVAIPSDKKLWKQLCENIPIIAILSTENIISNAPPSPSNRLQKADDLDQFIQKIKTTLASYLTQNQPSYILYLDRYHRQVSSKHVWILQSHILETAYTQRQEALFFKNVNASVNAKLSTTNEGKMNDSTQTMGSLDVAILHTINAALKNNEHSVLLRSVYVKTTTDIAAANTKYNMKNNVPTHTMYSDTHSNAGTAHSSSHMHPTSSYNYGTNNNNYENVKDGKNTSYNPQLEEYDYKKHRSMLLSPAIISYYHSLYNGKSKHEKSLISASLSYLDALNATAVHDEIQQSVLTGFNTQQGASALLGSLGNSKANTTQRRRPSIPMSTSMMNQRNVDSSVGATLDTVVPSNTMNIDKNSDLHTLFHGEDTPNSFDSTLLPACSYIYEGLDTLYENCMASFYLHTKPGFTVAAAQGALEGANIRYQYLCLPGVQPVQPVDQRAACPLTPEPTHSPSVGIHPYASPPRPAFLDGTYIDMEEDVDMPMSILRSPNICPVVEESSSDDEEDVEFLGDLPRGSVDFMLDRDGFNRARTPTGVFRSSPLMRGVNISLNDMDTDMTLHDGSQTVQQYSPNARPSSPLFSRPPTTTGESAAFRPSIRLLAKRDVAESQLSPPSIISDMKPQPASTSKPVYLRLDVYIDTTLIACSVQRGNSESGWTWAAPPVSSILVAHVTTETHIVSTDKETTYSNRNTPLASTNRHTESVTSFSGVSPVHNTLSNLLPPGSRVFDSVESFDSDQKGVYLGSNSLVFPLQNAYVKTDSVLLPPLAEEVHEHQDYSGASNEGYVSQVRVNKLHVRELEGLPVSGDVRVELRRLPASIAEQYYNTNTNVTANDSIRKKRSAQEKKKRELFKHSKYHEEGDSDGLDSSDESSSDDDQESEEGEQDVIIDESVDGVFYSNQVILHGGADDATHNDGQTRAKLQRLQERLCQTRDTMSELVALDITPRHSTYPSPYGTPMSFFAPSHLPSCVEEAMIVENLGSQFDEVNNRELMFGAPSLLLDVRHVSLLGNSASVSPEMSSYHKIHLGDSSTHRTGGSPRDSSSQHTASSSLHHAGLSQFLNPQDSFASMNLLALDISSDDEEEAFSPSVQQSPQHGGINWVLGCTCAMSFVAMKATNSVFHTLHQPQVDYPHTSGILTVLIDREYGEFKEMVHPVNTPVTLSQSIDMIHLYELSFLDHVQYIYVASDIKIDAIYAAEHNMVQKRKTNGENVLVVQPFTNAVPTDIVFTVLSCWTKRFQMLDSLALTGAAPANVHAVCIQHTLQSFSTSDLRKNDTGRMCDCSVSTITREYIAAHLTNCSSAVTYSGWPVWFLHACIDVLLTSSIPLQTLPCSCLTCNICNNIVQACLCVCDYCQFSYEYCICGSFTLANNNNNNNNNNNTSIPTNPLFQNNSMNMNTNNTNSVLKKHHVSKDYTNSDTLPNPGSAESATSNVPNAMPYHIPTCAKCSSLTSQCVCQIPLPKSFLSHGKLIGRCSFNTNMLPGPVLELRFEDIVDSRSIHTLKPSKAAFFQKDLVLGFEFALAPPSNPSAELIVMVPNENDKKNTPGIKQEPSNRISIPLSNTSTYSAPYTVAECLKYDYMLDEYYPSCPYRYLPAMSYVISLSKIVSRIRKSLMLAMIPVPRLVKNSACVDFFHIFYNLAAQLTDLTCSNFSKDLDILNRGVLPCVWLEDVVPDTQHQMHNKYVFMNHKDDTAILNEQTAPSTFLFHQRCMMMYMRVFCSGNTDNNTSIVQYIQRTLSFHLLSTWKHILQTHFSLTMSTLLSVHCEIEEEGKLKVSWYGCVETLNSVEWHNIKPCACVQEFHAILDCSQQTLRIKELNTNGYCPAHFKTEERSKTPVISSNADDSLLKLPNLLVESTSFTKKSLLSVPTSVAPVLRAKPIPNLRSRPPSAPLLSTSAQSLNLSDAISQDDSVCESPLNTISNASSPGSMSPKLTHTRNRSVFGFDSGFGRPLVTPHSHQPTSLHYDGGRRNFSYFTFEATNTNTSSPALNNAGNSFLISSPRNLNEFISSPVSTMSKSSIRHATRNGNSLRDKFTGHLGSPYISIDISGKYSYDESKEFDSSSISIQLDTSLTDKKKVNLEYSAMIADAPCNVHNISSCSCSACTVVTSLALVSASLLSTETLYSRSLNFCLAYVCQPLYMRCIQTNFKLDWNAKKPNMTAFYNLSKAFYGRLCRIEKRKNVLYKVQQSYTNSGKSALYYKTPTKQYNRATYLDDSDDTGMRSLTGLASGEEEYDLLSPLPLPRFEVSTGLLRPKVPSYTGEMSPALTLNSSSINDTRLTNGGSDLAENVHPSVLRLLTRVSSRMLTHWPANGRPVQSAQAHKLEQLHPRASAAQPAGEKRTVSKNKTDFYPPVAPPLLQYEDPFPLNPYSTIAAMLINVLPIITALQSRMGILISSALTSTFAAHHTDKISSLDEIEPYTMVYTRYLSEGNPNEPPPCAYDLATCCSCYSYQLQPVSNSKHQRWYDCICTTQPSKHKLLCPHEYLLLTKVNGLGPAGIALIMHAYARNQNFIMSKYVRCVEIVGKIIPKLANSTGGRRFHKSMRENRTKLRKRKNSFNFSTFMSTSGMTMDSRNQLSTNASLRTASILGSIVGGITVTNNKNNVTENLKKITHNQLACCNIGLSNTVLESISRTLHFVHESPNHRSLLTFYLAPLARFVALEESLNQYAALYTNQADAQIENQALFMDYYDQAAEETTGVCQLIRKSFSLIDAQAEVDFKDNATACICELKPTKLCKRCFVSQGYTRAVTRANLVRQLCISGANQLKIAVAPKELNLTEGGLTKSRQNIWEHALLPAKSIDHIMSNVKRSHGSKKMSIQNVQNHFRGNDTALQKSLQAEEVLARLAENCIYQAETMIFFAFRQHKIGKNTIRVFLFDPVSHFLLIVKLKPKKDGPDNPHSDVRSLINDNLRHIHNEYQECVRQRDDEHFFSSFDLFEMYKTRMREFVTSLMQHCSFTDHTFVGANKCAILQAQVKPAQLHVDLEARVPNISPDHIVSDVQWLVQGTQSQHDLLHYSRYISHISAQLYESGETTIYRTYVIPYFGDLFKRIMNTLDY